MKVLTLFEFKNQVAQLPPQEAKEVLRRARVYISRETFDQCQACGRQTLGGKKYCNKACKQKAWRTRRKESANSRQNAHRKPQDERATNI